MSDVWIKNIGWLNFILVVFNFTLVCLVASFAVLFRQLIEKYDLVLKEKVQSDSE